MKINLPNNTIRLPDFFIIGAAKSATTSMYRLLTKSSEIYIPPQLKEPGFFCFKGKIKKRIENKFPDLWSTSITNLRDYVSLYEKAQNNQILGDATPEYLLFAKETIKNISLIYRQKKKHLKFICILRNPVDRAWSHYNHMIRDNYENQSFENAINNKIIKFRLKNGWHPAYDYLSYGLYYRNLTLYINAFGKKNIKIILFEDLSKNPSKVYSEIFKFLGKTYPRNLIESYSRKEFNKSGKIKIVWLHNLLFLRESLLKTIIRLLLPNEFLQNIKLHIMNFNLTKSKISPDQKIKLINFYKKDINLLSSLIKKDLSHWVK